MAGWPGRLAASAPSERRRATTCSVVSANMAHGSGSASDRPWGCLLAHRRQVAQRRRAGVGRGRRLERLGQDGAAQPAGAPEGHLGQLGLDLGPAAARR